MLLLCSPAPTPSSWLRFAAITLPVCLLSACGGSSGGNDNVPVDDGLQASGVLVVPEAPSIAAETATLPAGLSVALRSTACPSVPDGYQPLVNAEVQFLDATGNTIGDSFQTNDCGEFAAAVPTDAANVKAAASGYRPITTDVAFFTTQGTDANVASAISTDAEYTIGAIQVLDNNRLAFTVSDTLTYQSVLGIPGSAVTIELDGVVADLTTLGYSVSESDAATALLVMDSSGSMSSFAWTDPDTDEYWSRSDLASYAAHIFVDQKSSQDQVGVLVFSSGSYFIDSEHVANQLSLVNAAGEQVEFTYPSSGFTTSPLPLHFALDAYNRESDIWQGSDGKSRHTSLPDDLFISGRYPYSGSTSLYRAIIDGLDILGAQAPARPVVIAMTDGRNNGGSTVDDVVQAALQSSTPVYTIGMSDDARSNSLIDIATRTGGSYFQVENTDIAGAYQSIQTGIVFQYIGALSAADDASAAGTLAVTLEYNGLQARRELTVNSDTAISMSF